VDRFHPHSRLERAETLGLMVLAEPMGIVAGGPRGGAPFSYSEKRD
jgi:hypothetical protein